MPWLKKWYNKYVKSEFYYVRISWREYLILPYGRDRLFIRKPCDEPGDRLVSDGVGGVIWKSDRDRRDAERMDDVI